MESRLVPPFFCLTFFESILIIEKYKSFSAGLLRFENNVIFYEVFILDVVVKSRILDGNVKSSSARRANL